MTPAELCDEIRSRFNDFVDPTAPNGSKFEGYTPADMTGFATPGAPRVGSVLSINSLREDLDVAFATARNWVAILDRTYATFRVPPVGGARLKAVKKEQKLYFWDWARVAVEGPRFENMLAAHLMRLVHWIEDVEGRKAELRYFRDAVGHEVDFVVLVEGRPWLAAEASLDEGPLCPGLRYFLERLRVPYAYQVALRGRNDWLAGRVGHTAVRAVPAARFLAHLP
jgi:predicted AAA+ superfamily ATPase